MLGKFSTNREKKKANYDKIYSLGWDPAGKLIKVSLYILVVIYLQ